MILKGTLGLGCIYMTQLVTHATFTKKPPTLQLCYNVFWPIAEGN